jgi:hypothetical protein
LSSISQITHCCIGNESSTVKVSAGNYPATVEKQQLRLFPMRYSAIEISILVFIHCTIDKTRKTICNVLLGFEMYKFHKEFKRVKLHQKALILNIPHTDASDDRI